MLGSYLLPLNWVVSHGPWWALLWCLLICPVIPQLLGVVFVSYWPPLNPRRFQFWAYFPGNVFLAMFIASMATTYPHGGFKVNVWINWSCLLGAAVVYLVLQRMDDGPYDEAQLITANKQYHNFLYFWYGYLAVASYIGMWETDASVVRKLAITVPGLLWLGCLVKDNLTSKEKLAPKFEYAHARRNIPLWRNGWRLRRRTANGYE